MRMMPRAAPRQCVCVHCACGQPPWSSRTITVESNMKSEHNLYLACEDSPRRAFLFCTFSCSCPLSFYCTLTSLLLFLNAANRRLHSVLNSAKHVHCRGATALSYPSSIVKKPCRPSFFPVLHCQEAPFFPVLHRQARHGHPVFSRVSGCDV